MTHDTVGLNDIIISNCGLVHISASTFLAILAFSDLGRLGRGEDPAAPLDRTTASRKKALRADTNAEEKIFIPTKDQDSGQAQDLATGIKSDRQWNAPTRQRMRHDHTASQQQPTDPSRSDSIVDLRISTPCSKT
ncbi:hypothetical protein CC78DRAFT_576883 [Lojkania enalia]|uniref:Uncharacterized protein n=1 Tax=Lojkania enalia TaxID=147567 RepID=A0A9P4KG40_9PLEO|nr:hypothetical protein CC78DRAFT_576883 [Didymosphaeria enalia]